MLLLVHKRYDGEPMGVWSEDGQSIYIPGEEAFQTQGARSISLKGTLVPWEEFVDQRVNAVNHTQWWGRLIADTLEQGLSNARNEFFAGESLPQASDK